MPLAPQNNPIGRLVLGVIVLLPLFFFIWYVMAPVLIWPLALLANWLLPLWFPAVIAEVVRSGAQLDVVTQLPLPPGALAQIPPGAIGELVFTVNPLIYCYNLPLFTALAIAVPGEEGAKWRTWSWGLPWLFMAQVWGVSFDTLKTLLFGIGPEAPNLVGFSAWQTELVALGYQLGFLILPSVLPIAIWFVLYRDYLASLVGDQRATPV